MGALFPRRRKIKRHSFMKKVTLSFPTYDTLWTFKEKSIAVNVAVSPRKNIIAGLFSASEVEFAIKEFQAIKIDDAPTTLYASSVSYRKRKTTKPSLKFKFHQLLSLLSL